MIHLLEEQQQQVSLKTDHFDLVAGFAVASFQTYRTGYHSDAGELELELPSVSLG